MSALQWAAIALLALLASVALAARLIDAVDRRSSGLDMSSWADPCPVTPLVLALAAITVGLVVVLSELWPWGWAS